MIRDNAGVTPTGQSLPRWFGGIPMVPLPRGHGDPYRQASGVGGVLSEEDPLPAGWGVFLWLVGEVATRVPGILPDGITTGRTRNPNLLESW